MQTSQKDKGKVKDEEKGKSPQSNGKGGGRNSRGHKERHASKKPANGEPAPPPPLPDAPPWRAYANNLPFTCTEPEIRAFFARAAPPEAVVMHTDQATGRFRGTCFVTFASRDELAEALKLDGEDLGGRPVGCSVADRTPTSGKNSAQPKSAASRTPFHAFAPHLSLEEVKQGIQEKRMVVGVFHCSKYIRSIAFVRNPLFVGGDVMVDGWTQRNRALPGDVVVVQLHDRKEWKERGAVLAGEMAYPTPKRDTKRDLMVDTQAAARLVRHALGPQLEPLAYQPPPQFETATQPSGDVVYILQRRPALGEKTVICRFIPGDQTNAVMAAAAAAEDGEAEEALEPPTAAVRTVSHEEDDETGEVIVFQGIGGTAGPPGPAAPAVPLPAPDPADTAAPARPPANPGSPDRFLKFRPDDDTYPIVLVPQSEILQHLEWKELPNYLYRLRLERWDLRSQFPVGSFVMFLGKVGTIEAETRALLAVHQVCTDEFSAEIQAEVNKPFGIPSPEELRQQHRRDLRKEEFSCTIDPATARDLDDALSCEQLPDGSFRVGVHIADVSHFVPNDSLTDQEASRRCTTVYVVQRAIPMLPRILSEDYCSLNANQDKFAFSVIWRLSPEGEILSEWFGKSVIHNYCRMSYDMAQAILDDRISDDQLDLGSVSPAEKTELCARVRRSVKNLNALALVLRKKRFENGCLRLQRERLGFVFPTAKDGEGHDTRHEDTRFAPQGIYLYEMQQANHLVEEFMLLANMQVAQKLVSWLPVQSLVRRHGGPLRKKLEPALEVIEQYGVRINAQSGPAMAQSLASLGTDRRAQIVRLALTYCMQLAKYCCSDDVEELGLHHFALNVPLYTHFTSPIRRYADVIVHRTLDFILQLERNGETPPPLELLPLAVVSAKDTLEQMRGASATSLLANWTEAAEAREGRSDFVYPPEVVENISQDCNVKKLAAKKAQDASILVYFCYYLKSLQQSRAEAPYLECKAYVVSLDFKKKTFNVFVPEYALDYQVTAKEISVQPWESLEFDPTEKKPVIKWKTGETTVVNLLTTFEAQIQYVERQGRMSFDLVCLKETEL
eukprot:EG_transcript_1172